MDELDRWWRRPSSFEAGEQLSEPAASFPRTRGLLPVLFFPRGASFPALEGVCARAHRGSENFRATCRDDRLRARLGRLRAPNRRLRAAWSRLGAALA